MGHISPWGTGTTPQWTDSQPQTLLVAGPRGSKRASLLCQTKWYIQLIYSKAGPSALVRRQSRQLMLEPSASHWGSNFG